MIALISCCKLKSHQICRAKDMYISPLFRYSYRYACRYCRDIYTLGKVWINI